MKGDTIMATITLNYDARNITVRKFIDALLSINGVTIKNEPKQPKYSKAMINKIEQGEKDFKTGNYKVIKTEDLWK